MDLLEFMSLTLTNMIYDNGWNLSLNNGIPTACKELQSHQSASDEESVDMKEIQ